MTKQEVLDYLDNVLHPIVSPDNWSVYSELHDMIEELPSAEPVRHGKWIEYSFPAHECIYCSECKEEYAPEALWDLDGNSLPNYCPFCGARMDEE